MANEEDLEEIFSEKKKEDQFTSANSVDESPDDLFSALEDNTDLNLKSHDGALAIGKMKYAIGLKWNTVFDETSVTKEARIAAKADKEEADFFCIRSGDAPQFGLGHKSKGHRTGMPSLAAAIHDIYENDWVAVFRVGGNFYLAAARDDLIISEYDQLIYSEDDAKDAFSNLLVSASWDKAIAPQSWGFDGTEEQKLDDLELSPKLHRLRTANPTKNLIRIGIFCAVIAGVGFGLNYGYNAYLEHQEEIARKIALERERNENVNKVVRVVEDAVEMIPGVQLPDTQFIEQPPQPPWFGKRNGIGELITCTSGILDVDLQVPGWATSTISCRAGSVHVGFLNRGGTTTWAENYLNENGFPDLNLDRSVGAPTIQVSIPAPFVTTYPYDVDAQDLTRVGSYLKRHFEELRLELEWNLREANPTNILDRYYNAADFTFETLLSPDNYAPLFSRIKGFEITNITYNIESSTWQVQGSVYQKRPTPLPRPEGQ